MVNMTNNNAIKAHVPASVEDVEPVTITAGQNETDATLSIEDGQVVVRLPYATRRSSADRSTLIAAVSGTAKGVAGIGDVRVVLNAFVKDGKVQKPSATQGISAAADPSSRVAALMTLTNAMIAQETAISGTLTNERLAAIQERAAKLLAAS